MPTREQYEALWDAQAAAAAAVDTASDAEYDRLVLQRQQAEADFNAAADAEIEAGG